ncbi:MAG: CHRD domain-containing protein [Phycisphaerales bacterium JB039]
MSIRGLAAAAAALFVGAGASAEILQFEFAIGADQTVPPVMSAGSGFGQVTIDTDLLEMSWEISFADLSGDATAAHFHGPAPVGVAAGVQVDIGAISGLTSPMIGSTTITEEQLGQIVGGLWYVNIHTAMHPTGEIRGQVNAASPDIVTFQFPIDGSQEVVPVTTSGSGTGEVSIDLTTNELSWRIEYAGLSGPAVNAHIHGPAMPGATAGVQVKIAMFSGGAASPMVGSTTITDAQVGQLLSGLWYVNIYTAMYSTGEIRGQVVQTCYADCDGSGSLDVFDFLCFQNNFATGDSDADCDGSGTLDLFDFLCFQNEFSAGCP